MDKLYIPPVKKESNNSQYVLYDYESYRYLMKVHKGSKEEFMMKAGVNNGYAYYMFSTLYDAIFSEFTSCNCACSSFV